MADFHQTGKVPTLHRFNSFRLDKIERELEGFSRDRPICLIIPALASEFDGQALPDILENLSGVRYLNQVVLTLDRASEEDFQRAHEALSILPQPVRIIWNSGPRILELYRKLKENGLAIGESGKGRSCWLAYGYLLSSRKADVIALHDADILTYNREMLARLCYPVANPHIAFEFSKGYYARFTNRLNGRVTRLFTTPLIRSLRELFGRSPYLKYLDSFRYPLAGEFAMKADLARVNRIPADWGLEIGVLGEIFRNCSPNRICQVELCERYDHKHQDLSAGDPSRGLMKMATDIAKNLFRSLAAESLILTPSILKTLLIKYQRQTEDLIACYQADALMNHLEFDRHEEESSMEAFVDAIRTAGQKFLDDPIGTRFIPNWTRVTSALPDILEELRESVEADNEDIRVRPVG